MWPWLLRIALVGTAPESPKILAPQQFLTRGLHQIDIQLLWTEVAVPGL
jgi:hypothetical protein